MYNPINMNIEDENRLKDRDQREKNKKKRYEARHNAEVQTREETLAEQDRLDKMSLQKVSRMRVAEELNRGFDILTNGQLRGGLAQINATSYMKEPPKVWDRITPSGDKQANIFSANEASASGPIDLEFAAQNFDRRSKRLNTNMARNMPANTQPAAVESGSQVASSAKPPASKASSKISSAKPAVVQDPTPASTRSQASSQRPIRTGGFQKLGAQIVH